jgi:hypothetical protein
MQRGIRGNEAASLNTFYSVAAGDMAPGAAMGLVGGGAPYSVRFLSPSTSLYRLFLLADDLAGYRKAAARDRQRGERRGRPA